MSYLRLARAILGVGVLVLLGACTAISSLGQFPVAPEALKSASAASGVNNLEKVHDLLQDSQQKCDNFKIAVFKTSAESNTQLGVVGTLFSAAATVVKPITVVHALTGVNTVATGTKTTISSEYLNGLTSSHITQAIQATYSADVSKYTAYLNAIKDPNAVSVVAERTKILSIHGECNLPAADGSISSAIQSTPPSQGKLPALAVTYTVGKNETAATIASGIMSSLNKDASFQAAGISAALQSDTTVITINIPTNIAVTWKTPVAFVPPQGATTPSETATFQQGPPATLKISGNPDPKGGDSITLAASVSPTTGVPSQRMVLNANYSVTAADSTPDKVAAGIASSINADTEFKKIGGMATAVGSMVTLVSSTSVTWGTPFQFKSSSGSGAVTEVISFSPGPPTTISVSGTSTTGDSITISATAADAVANASTTLPLAPPAAIQGLAPAFH